FAPAADGATLLFFFSSRRRHTRSKRDWSSDVCSSDLASSLNQHPQLRSFPPVKSLRTAMISFPQSQRQRQPRRSQPRFLGSSAGPRTTSRPKRCPVISMAFDRIVSDREHPQLNVGCVLDVSAFCSTVISLPQSHRHTQRRAGFPFGDIYGVLLSLKTTSRPKRCPVKSLIIARSTPDTRGRSCTSCKRRRWRHQGRPGYTPEYQWYRLSSRRLGFLLHRYR